MTIFGNRLLLPAVITGLVLAALPARGNVSLRNGNFFIGYTDIIYPGGFEPKLERVYNSKTAYKGLYGWGWGLEYDVYLEVIGDGNILAHEYGGGAENLFSPQQLDNSRLEAVIDQIIRAAEKIRDITNTEQLKKETQRLRMDATYRNDRWQHFLRKRLVANVSLPVGTVLRSDRFSHQIITRTRDGYERKFDSGRIEEFNNVGRLVSIKDFNNNFIRLTYDVRGKLQTLVDNYGRKMLLTVNDAGLLEKVVGEHGKEVILRYNDAAELIYSRDVDGNEYRFEYTADRRHNMTKITYTDGTVMEMTYYPRDNHESIKSIKDRDGTVTGYTYAFDPADRGHYTVGVTVKGTDGKVINIFSYEYFLRFGPQGEEWLQRMISILDDDKTDTEYNAIGLPVKVQRGKDYTTFEYDSLGHVTRKDSPFETTEMRYHPVVSKVIYVKRTSKSDHKDSTWSKFDYDVRGNLIRAENSEKQTVALDYDANGRISALTDQKKMVIKFTYNQNSKPVRIEQVGLGAITVTYTDSGEIKKVDSDVGEKVALQVTTSFQNLRDLIKPAGVNLSF